MSKNLREDMPNTADWIDELRQAFGADVIDGRIRKAMKGEPTFSAEENGHSFGTPVSARARCVVAWDDRGIGFSVDLPAGLSTGAERPIMDAARAIANKRKFDRRGQIVNQGN